LLQNLLADTITVQRAPLISGGYGNSYRDWPNATSTDYPCYVSFVSSTEEVVNLNETQTRGKVTLGPDADIEPTDRLVYGGNTYEVDGDVMPSLRRGVLHHQRVVMRRVELAQG
jgi:hypothetical protein